MNAKPEGRARKLGPGLYMYRGVRLYVPRKSATGRWVTWLRGAHIGGARTKREAMLIIDAWHDAHPMCCGLTTPRANRRTKTGQLSRRRRART